MNNITYAVSVDVNNPIIPYNVYVASVLDSNVRYLEITLYQNGNVIVLSNTATATASLVTDDVLIDDSVECTISDNIITVPLEGLQRHGNLDVQVTVTEDTKVLAIPFPIQVRVTPNIAENAQIDENSLGSYAEVVHEIAEARGSYDKLKDRLDHTAAALALKPDKSSVYTKAEIDNIIGSGSIVSTINSQSQTGDDVNYPSVNAVRNYAKMVIDDWGEVMEDEINEVAGDLEETVTRVDQTAQGNAQNIALVIRPALNELSTGKADKGDVYTKAEIDNIIGSGSIVSTINSQSQTGDDVNYPSVNAVRNYAKMVIDDWGDAIEDEINEVAGGIPTKTSDLTNDSGFLTAHQDISGKADKATTLAGYGITNAYTKAEVDGKIGSGSVVQVIGNQPQTGDDVNYPSVSAARNYTKLLANEVKGLMEDAIGELSENIPTKTSDLTNDSGFLTQHQDISGKVDKTQKIAGVDLQDDITAAELKTALNVPTVPTNISAFTNDANYLTLATLPIYNGGVQ